MGFMLLFITIKYMRILSLRLDLKISINFWTTIQKRICDYKAHYLIFRFSLCLWKLIYP